MKLLKAGMVAGFDKWKKKVEQKRRIVEFVNRPRFWSKGELFRGFRQWSVALVMGEGKLE